jgi:hypothetical protein
MALFLERAEAIIQLTKQANYGVVLIAHWFCKRFSCFYTSHVSLVKRIPLIAQVA